jgi:hypothetical protein
MDVAGGVFVRLVLVIFFAVTDALIVGVILLAAALSALLEHRNLHVD